MKKAILFLILGLLILSNSFGQIPLSQKESILEAESYFLYEEYADALPIYLKLFKEYPNNANFKYKIGVCYLNLPYVHHNSISYLESAVKMISTEYKDGYWKETFAPTEAWYELGNAYRINGLYDKAIEVYNKFKSIAQADEYDLELVNHQIDACRRAKKAVRNPIYFEIENLGNIINSRNEEKRPVVSGNGKVMAYISELKFYNALFIAKKNEDGIWGNPINMMPELEVDNDAYPACLSYDGNEIIIYRNDNYDGNLYSSHLENGVWTKLEKLNSNINTKYWESHACLSPDGKTLYFTSNRKDGYGGLDIYKSTRTDGNNWGPATNLGPEINSIYNDDAPYLTQDGNTIYFSSFGHSSIGGYDIFKSHFNGTKWSEPENLGYPINTPNNDMYFQPILNGEYAYYGFNNQSDGYGKKDIYKVEFFSDLHPKIFNISGQIFSMDTIQKLNLKDVKLYLVNKETSDTTGMVSPNEDGNYKISVPQGKYEFIATSNDTRTHREELDLKINLPKRDITKKTILEHILTLRQDSASVNANNIILTDSIIVKDTRKTKISINLVSEGEITIEMIHNNEKTPVIKESVKEGEFVFKLDPDIFGDSIQITHKDKNNNVTIRYIQLLPHTDESSIPVNHIKNNRSSYFSNLLEQIKLDSRSAVLLNAIENIDNSDENITNPRELNLYLSAKVPTDSLNQGINNVLSKIENEILINKLKEGLPAYEKLINDSIATHSTKEDIMESINQQCENDSIFAKHITYFTIKELNNLSEEKAKQILIHALSNKDVDTNNITSNYLLQLFNTSSNENTIESITTVLSASITHQLINEMHTTKNKLVAKDSSVYTNISDYLANNRNNNADLNALALEYALKKQNTFDYLYSTIKEKVNDKYLEYLNSISLNQENINNLNQLIEYLELNNKEEIAKNLFFILFSEAFDIKENTILDSESSEIILSTLSSRANGNLKNFLSTLSYSKYNGKYIDSILNDIFANASKYNYSNKEILQLLKTIISTKINFSEPREEPEKEIDSNFILKFSLLSILFFFLLILSKSKIMKHLRSNK